ncbi:MAG: MgtC/SapB family protein [Eubacteriales bacterium]|jgi:putative Mg2+ transporter-C (MgtC) family protein
MPNLTDPLINILGNWAAEVSFTSVLFRFALSLVFSAIIGWERSTKRHAAGLRTFILISLASTGAMLLDVFLSGIYFDFTVISAAAVIAIAILSSNSVLYSSKSQIKGLTTSAGLWATGIIGLCIGAGFYTAALIGFAVILTVLSVFPSIEVYLKNRSNHFEIHLELKNKSNLTDFVTTIRKLGLKIDDIEANPAYLNSGLSVYSISLTISFEELKKFKTHKEIIEALSTLEYVNHIEEMN